VDVSKSEEKALNLALNNQAIQGDWSDGLEALLLEVQGEMPDLYDDLLLHELDVGVSQANEEETKLKQLPIDRPPTMAWILIGIPVVKYGEIAEDIEQLAENPDITMEMTANNGKEG
ncbi:MAG: hypothetical protein R6U40_05135, partial [Desulfobacterales bacterium]